MNNNYDIDDYRYVDEDLYNTRYDDAYRVTYRNDEKIKNVKNPLLKRVVLTGVITTTILVASKIVNRPPTLAPTIPDGYQQIYINELVDYGETLDDITSKYYTENEALYYTSYRSFVKTVEQRNNIEYMNINNRTTISIPVIIEKDNEYYNNIKQLEAAIPTKEEWVSYKIQDGDTLYSLAWLGSGNGDQAMDNVEKIMIKNNLNDTVIESGKKIYIINPEIGDIRKEIEKLNNELYNYVTTGNKNINTK